jgi:hypothetical protein
MICHKCQSDLPREKFIANPHMIDGVYPWCRGCVAEMTDAEYRNYRRAYMRQYMPCYYQLHTRNASKRRRRWRVLGVGELTYDTRADLGALRSTNGKAAQALLSRIDAVLTSFGGGVFRFESRRIIAVMDRLCSEGKAEEIAWRAKR